MRPITKAVLSAVNCQSYIPPPLAAKIARYAPACRLSLAIVNTPIHPWLLPDLPSNIQLFVKRDDMTGSVAGGNKVRKLEFLLSDALMRKCDTVITGGGVQSNHARATAALCAQLGIDCHVLLRATNNDPAVLGADGNVLLHRLFGSHIHLTRVGPGLKLKMDALADRLRNNGAKPYVIDIGGSDHIGLWGYIQCFHEMVQQGVPDTFTDIVLPIGSGGTASGIAIANHLCGAPLRVHAAGVCDSPQYFYDHLATMLAAVHLDVEPRTLINIVDVKGRGYARNTPEELHFCARVAQSTGIVLDRVYTGKAAFWLHQELCKEDGLFAGRDAKVLFLHTGGLFGVFDRQIEDVLEDGRITKWVD